MEYVVEAKRTGYVVLEAENERSAMELASNLSMDDFDWKHNDSFIVSDAQEYDPDFGY